MFQYCINKNEVREEDYPLLGGKAQAFAKLRDYSLPIPNWFVVKNEAFYSCLTEKQKKVLEHNDWKEAKKELENFELSETVLKEIQEQIEELKGEYFAVRSSALSEDGLETSFAGQFESYLWLPKEQIVTHIKKCFLSGFSQRVFEYRKQNHLNGTLEVPSVIVQKMVNAECAGVCFAVNPQNADIKTSVVSAVFGLGSALVDGVANADTYYIENAEKLVDENISKKNVMHVVEANKVVTKNVSKDKSSQSVLSKEQAVEVAQLAKKTSRLLRKYQDIEWAYENGKLYLLQSRPITSLKNVMPVLERASLFDNSNIAESYNGVTLPLTFSYIRIAYDGVYRQFCKMFGVTKKQIKKNDRTFRNMLGMTDGRVYYNMRSWYRMMSILPGYKFNKEFMEQMMGVKEKLPESFVIQEEKKVNKIEKIADGFHFFWSIIMFGVQYVTLNKKIRRFYKMIKKTLGKVDVSYLTMDELYEYLNKVGYTTMEGWDAPLINDFFTMIYHGILRKICDKWIGIDGICNALLCGQGGIISAKPAKMIWKMSQMGIRETCLVKCLLEGTIGEIEEELKGNPVLEEMIKAYLDEFGDRCLDELKMESESVRENPLLLYRTIGETTKHSTSAASKHSDMIAKEAYQKAMDKLSGKPFKKLIFKKILRSAGRFVRNRENLRFERTKVFGCVRSIFNEMGVRLASMQALEDSKDIFYLNIEEILSYIDGTATTYRLKDLVSVRKKEYEYYKTLPETPRFMVYGQVGQAVKVKQNEGKQKVASQKVLKGIPCSPGVVEGKARVIYDCRNAVMKEGEILVANHTDPGWIMLFNQASAVVVECGSLLSHAAIVSREMGIPSVVAVDEVSKRLHTGDFIRVNGSTGTVEILETTNETKDKIDSERRTQ